MVDAILFVCNAGKIVVPNIPLWLGSDLGTTVFDCNTHKPVTVVLLASSEWDAGKVLIVSNGANKVISDVSCRIETPLYRVALVCGINDIVILSGSE